MNIQDILTGGGVVFVLLTIIQITPIKLDPWSAIARIIGRAINGEVMTKVDKLSHDLQEMKATEEERDAVNARIRILQFGDELCMNVRHTRERFNQILADIDMYENYCDTHPTFENNQSVMTIQNIKDVYHDCMKKHDFL